MKNNTIAIEGFTKQFRNEIIQRIEWATHDSGGCIVDVTSFSGLAIMLQIEAKPDRLGTFYDCLKTAQLGLGEEAGIALRAAASAPDTPNKVLVNLSVKFISNAVNLGEITRLPPPIGKPTPKSM